MFESLDYADDYSSVFSSAKLLPLLTVTTLCTMLGVDIGNKMEFTPTPKMLDMRLFDLDFLNFNTGFNVSQKVYDIGRRMETGVRRVSLRLHLR
jgi:hypothetical protein